MIAYISPLLPKKTGIARYSHHLIKALQVALAGSGTELAIFDDDVDACNNWQNDYRAEELFSLVFEANRRRQYKQFVYHFGNSPDFHFTLLQLLREQAGIVVLHDTVLFYLTTGRGAGELWRSLTRQSHKDEVATMAAIREASPQHDVAQYPHPEHYPGIDEILAQATAVVVHSQLAKTRVREAGYTRPIYQVPLIDYRQPSTFDIEQVENEAIKKIYVRQRDEQIFIIGVFGFAGQTKRRQSILQALEELPKDVQARVQLLIIGVDIYQNNVVELGLSELVVSTGYINDVDYDQAMALCDIIINLRYPSMGETSAVQIQAMSAKKPTIVSNHAWFSELPDNSVHKIAVGDAEVEGLKHAISTLLNNESYRQQLAQAAQDHVREAHSPPRVAQQWLDILGLDIDGEDQTL